jgi:hypothetical protein
MTNKKQLSEHHSIDYILLIVNQYHNVLIKFLLKVHKPGF